MVSSSSEAKGLEHLPSALLATIIMKLDVTSICSIAATCRTFHACGSQILSFLPNFHLLDTAPPVDLLRPLLLPNPHLQSLKVDCNRLDDTAIEHLLRPSLNELHLNNCTDFSGKLLSEIGGRCRNLRSLYLGSVAEKRGCPIHVSDLEELLGGCSQLETLSLMFDVTVFLRHNFARAWALASAELTALEIGYVSSVMVIELLSPTIGTHQPPNHMQTSVLPNIQHLSLSVDYVTDTLVCAITEGLVSLTYLDLRDAPIIQPTIALDLTNHGLLQINKHGKLKHLSLVRSQEYLVTSFRRVNDLGVLLMADNCSNLESICLGGFSRVTDTGFRAVLHSCSRLYKLRVSRGAQMTDLVFHDIVATSLSLTHVSLRWCNLLTSLAVSHLASNVDLRVLDLRDCRNLGDEALQAISFLPKLNILLLDGSDISDMGLTCLRHGVMGSLVSLSIRRCKRLTDRCISALFDGGSGQNLQDLDLSHLPNISDNGILLLVKNRVPIVELRMRGCPLIGDISIMALASMQVDGGWQCGSSLRLLDLYNCRGITQLAFRWLKKPYFPRLRWLGVTRRENRDSVDALMWSRPFLRVACHGEEIGIGYQDKADGLYCDYYKEVDELEQWLLEGEEGNDEEMGEAQEAGDDDNDDDELMV